MRQRQGTMVSNPVAPSVNGDASTTANTSNQGSHKYKRIAVTTANVGLMWRTAIMAACMLPLGMYIIATAGTAALDAYYVVVAAVPPFVASAYYLATYTTCPGFVRASHRLLKDSDCYAVPKFQQA